MNETSVYNIYQKMLLIQAEMPTVAKNLNVQTGAKSGYKAVSQKDILDAVKPLEKKYGVYSHPLSREIIKDEVLEQEGSNGKRLSHRLEIRVFYEFINVDNPEERIVMDAVAVGIDPGDKAPGKAMTYADKYALMNAYKISTGEDPDQQASEEYTAIRKDVPSTQDLVMLNAMIHEGTFDGDAMLKNFGVASIDQLSKSQVDQLLKVGYQRRAVKASESA